MVDQAVVRPSHPLQSTPDEAHSGKVTNRALRIQTDTKRPVAEAPVKYWQTEAEELMAELRSRRASRAQTNLAAEHRRGHDTTVSFLLKLSKQRRMTPINRQRMREARRKAKTKQRTANPELSRPPDKPNPSKTPWWLLGNQNTGEVPSEALNIAFRFRPEGQNGEVLAKQRRRRQRETEETDLTGKAEATTPCSTGEPPRKI
ncbi:unnamed protein product [Brassica oleracea]